MQIINGQNRGMLLETIINQTNSFYMQNKICLVHKKNLDIKFKGVSVQNKKLITKSARIINKSTVDYYGIWDGKFLAFEAKSTENKNFSLSNIKKHQIEYLSLIEAFKGTAFWIIYFKLQNVFIMIRHRDLITNIKNKKTLKFSEALKIGFEMQLNFPGVLNYIDIINKNWMS